VTAGLRPAIADYLEVRRSLGYKLARPEKLLAQFAGYLEQAGAVTVTAEHALAWAVLPGGNPDWHAYRLAVVRGFAAWLRTIDPAAEIPPAGLIPSRKRRATPYLYSDTEHLPMAAARRTPRPADQHRPPLANASARSASSQAQPALPPCSSSPPSSPPRSWPACSAFTSMSPSPGSVSPPATG
jgi:hypothetical protein